MCSVVSSEHTTHTILKTFVIKMYHLYRSKGNIKFYFESDFETMKIFNKSNDLLPELPIPRAFKPLIKLSLKAA